MSRAPHEPHRPGSAEGAVPSPRAADHHTSGDSRDPTQESLEPSTSATGRSPAAFAAIGLIGLFCFLGLVYQGLRMWGGVRVFTAELLLALVFAAATLALGFWVLRRIRPVRAPVLSVSVFAVVWGLFGATGVSLLANSSLLTVWSHVLGIETAGAWGPALSAPINEELAKLAGVVFLAVVFPRAVRGPIDGFVFGSLVGLGFQVAENVVYALNSILQAGATAPVLSVVQTTVIRAAATGLGSHWAMSAIAGTAVGLLTAVAWRPSTRRAVGAALLLLLAMTLHGIFNSPPAQAVGLLAAPLLVFVTTMIVYFVVRRSYRRRVSRALADEGEALGMRRPAARSLVSRHGRRRELGHVARPEQPAVRRRQQQMLETAEEHAARHTRRQ